MATYHSEMDIKDRAVNAINEAIAALQRMSVAFSIEDSNLIDGKLSAKHLDHAIAAHRHLKEAASAVHQIAIAQRKPNAFLMRDLMEKAATALIGDASYATLGVEKTKKTIELLQGMARNVKILAEARAPTHQECVAMMGGRLLNG